jgi:hypothetical protein
MSANAGMTERWDVNTNTAYQDVTNEGATVVLASAGATGNKTTTIDSASSRSLTGYLLAIQPVMSGASDTTLTVKHNQIRNGDRLLMQANGKIEFMAVTAGPVANGSNWDYTVTRDLDGTGANDWYAGDAVVNTGTAGSGFIDLYSLESVLGSPPEYIYNYNNTGTAFSANYAGESSFTLFGDGANTEVGDCMYFGMENTPWEHLWFTLGTAGVYTATLAWEYWNGSSWSAISGIDLSTNFLKSTGQHYARWYVSSLPGWTTGNIGVGPYAYWIRCRISAFTSWTTSPVQSGRRVYRYKSQFGPSGVGWTRNSAIFNDITEAWAVGNLNGLYGYGADTYGFAAGKYSDTTSWISADATNGFRILRGSTILGQWEADGDFFLGTGVGTAATTNIAVFNSDQTYNSESVGTGDLLLGDNSANKANILWDKSAGRLNFRGGTTTTAYIDTTGKLTAGGGNVMLDSAGIKINTGNDETAYIYWGDYDTRMFSRDTGSTLVFGTVIGNTTGGYVASALSLLAYGSAATKYTSILLDSTEADSYVDIAAYNNSGTSDGSYLRIFPTYSKASHDFQVVEGLYVGGTYSAPLQGYIYAEGNVSALSFTDRTPYPASLQDAYDALRSLERKGNGLDHEKLHRFVKAEGGRDLSATVSALAEVVKDLAKRIEILEKVQ